ncbi:polar amino acid transport system substrate-binding protein (plasmid) [Paraburkholderia phenoliruptrix BR3459a]|nr:polar amino acid transport system substrate-binding protein [Paraburkholderia phenoliruptrix BR3459a]
MVSALTVQAAGSDSQIPAAKPNAQIRAMLPENIRASGVLKLATDAHYPPCESFADDNKTLVGWEPDFWNAIGQVLGVKVEAESINFSSLIPGVASKRYDLAMECLTDTKEREKQVTFVDVMHARTAAYTMDQNRKITNDPLSLCGQKVGTQQATTFSASVDKVVNPYCTGNGRSPVENAVFPAADDTLLALYSGRVDFVLNTAMAVGELKKKAPKPIRVVDIPGMPTNFIGIIVPKENTQLADALLAATKALHEQGIYDQIVRKWSLEQLKLDDPGINLAPGQ